MHGLRAFANMAVGDATKIEGAEGDYVNIGLVVFSSIGFASMKAPGSRDGELIADATGFAWRTRS